MRTRHVYIADPTTDMILKNRLNYPLPLVLAFDNIYYADDYLNDHGHAYVITWSDARSLMLAALGHDMHKQSEMREDSYRHYCRYRATFDMYMDYLDCDGMQAQS